MKVGVLHPGAMGALVGAACRASTYWASSGRSPASADRAAQHGLIDAGGLTELVATVDVIVSVCPPHAALQVAGDVAALGFAGIYVDANAVSPAVALQIDATFDRFVDGSIIGPPPRQVGTSRLYLSGDEAGTVAAFWLESRLEPVVLGRSPGDASALKMAYAGWTKGRAALLLAMRSYAEVAGVGEALDAEWARSIPELVGRVERVARGVGPKAWRFTGEMEQIASALADRGLPGGFHEAAADVYARLADLQGTTAPTTEDVLGRVIRGDGA